MLFFLVALSVVGLIHWYLWSRLVRHTTLPKTRARRVGTSLLLGIAGLTIVTFIGNRVMPRALHELFAWPGYFWLALMFYLVLILAVLEIPALIARIVLRRKARVSQPQPELALVGGGSGGVDHEQHQQHERQQHERQQHEPEQQDGPTDVSRRLFLARTVAITAGVAATGLVASGISSALGPPRIKKLTIALARLPRAAEGTRIALVSDIHLGPLLGYDHTRRIVDLINELDADLVAVVGDLVDGSVQDLGPAARPLEELRSRQGAYFVTGNHEYFSGHEPWVTEIDRLGLRVLRNTRVELPNGLDIAGVNDPLGAAYGDAPHIDQALADRDPSRAVVLLAHQPIAAKSAAERGVDLQLSGHTHGGQMVPFNLIVSATGQPVVSGLGEVDGMPVYVTNGAGFWGPPVRVGAPPDISLIELRSQ